MNDEQSDEEKIRKIFRETRRKVFGAPVRKHKPVHRRRKP